MQALRGRHVEVDDLEVFDGGNRRQLGVTATPIRDESGTIQYAIAAFQDITELKRNQKLLEDYSRNLEEQVKERTRAAKEAQQVAEAANEAKSTFLANMSHEVRTPLNAVMGLTSLGFTSRTAGPHRRLSLTGSTPALARCCISSTTFWISHVSKPARWASTRSISIFGKCSIHSKTWWPKRPVEKGSSSWSIWKPMFLATYMGDPHRLRQVLSNLAFNAVKFTRKGTVTVRVAREDEQLGRLRFSVSDTGIGIEPDQLPRLFDSFTQVDDSSARRYGGAGLGLAICKHLVELMGGTMEAESQPGQGSTFAFVLELKPVAATHGGDWSGLSDPDDPEQALEESLAGLKVLVVEDVEINQQILCELLEPAGVHVSLADDGHQAVERVNATTFDAVLMDVQMPGMDGFEATRILRSQGFTDLPIIALTARAMTGDREKCLEAGMNAHVTKPLSFSNLIRVLVQHTRGTDPGNPAPQIDLNLDALHRSFAKNHGGCAAEIAEALEQGQVEEAQSLIHRLLGVAGNLKLMEVYHAAQKIQEDLRRGEDADPARLVAEMEAALATIAALPKSESKVKKAEPLEEADLDRLDELLSVRSLEASSLFEQLRQQSSILEPLAEAMEQLDYDAARKALASVRDKSL